MSTSAILWVDAESAASMTQAQWNKLGAGAGNYGFDGVVCVLGGHNGAYGLPFGPASGAGGASTFGGADVYGASPSGSPYQQQLNLGQSGHGGACDKAHTAGLKVYLGWYLENNNVEKAPCNGDWFNNTGQYAFSVWAQTCQDIAAGAAWCGFDGLAFDTEGNGGIDWSWNYVGNTNNQSTTNTQVKNQAATMASSLVTGFGSATFEVLIYCSLLTGAQIQGGYYDSWATWYNAHQGGSYSAASTFTFTNFVTGLSQHITGPIVCGNALYYDAINVTTYGPYGSLGSGLANPWSQTNGALHDEATATSNLGISNVYISPFVWLADNTDGGQGQWTQAQWNGAAPTIQGHSQNSTFLVYQSSSLLSGGNLAINYADYNGSTTNVNYTPLDGGGGGGGGAIALVQQTATVTSHTGSTQAVLTISATAAGDFLLLEWCNPEDGATISSVTDSSSETWLQANIENDSATTADSEIWYFPNCAAGITSVTVNLTGGVVAASSHAFSVSEWSGVATVSPLDLHPAGATGVSATASSPASGTPAVADELFAAVVAANANVSGGPGGGFTGFTWGAVPNTNGGYLIATDTSAHTMTQALVGSTSWSGTIASFKPAGTVTVNVTGSLAGTGTLTATITVTPPVQPFVNKRWGFPASYPKGRWPMPGFPKWL